MYNIFEQNIYENESNVRSYPNCFPFTIDKAEGSWITDIHNQKYLDFFSCAGSLNYGHNNPILKKYLIDYIERNGVSTSLDMQTVAKSNFLNAFYQYILIPRSLKYKVQFCGPTGTNCVESALKLSSKITSRNSFVTFENGFHGMTLGSLSVTSNSYYKKDITNLINQNVHFLKLNSPESVKKLYELDPKPAALIVETIQAEGGINVTDIQWLKEIEVACKELGIIFIVDDIQTGCGRTGNFFSFERYNIIPDIVLLSKSIGGYGLPMSLVLIKPDLDCWRPGEHTGTFRGNNLAFITGEYALKHYWENNEFSEDIKAKSKYVKDFLRNTLKDVLTKDSDIRGEGLLIGVELQEDIALKVQKLCFNKKLIIETCGRNDQVIKLIPPLTTTETELKLGLDILCENIKEVCLK